MSASDPAAPDSSLNVRYTREVQGNRGAGVENQVEILEDEEHHADLGPEKASPHTPKDPVKTRCLTAATLGAMYLLILAGLYIRYISVTLEKDQLQTRYDELSSNCSQLQEEITDKKDTAVNNSRLQDEVKQLKDKIEGKRCPEGWERFGFSCYFKSNGNKTWANSRSDCWGKGADLVTINSREEQTFVIDLNMDGESWIGLRATKETQTGRQRKWEWEWVDGSPLTDMFGVTTSPQQNWNQNAAAYCDQHGRWRLSKNSNLKNWICEKQIS